MAGGIDRTTDFMPDCVIVFCVRDRGQTTTNSPDDDQSELCFASDASGTNHSQTNASETNHSQASAGHGIEWR